MVSSNFARVVVRVVIAGACASLLSACGGGTGMSGMFGGSSSPPPPDPPQVAEVPASIRAEEIVGRWGFGAYHRPQDKARTEASARGACGRQPYVINSGASGGVIMHLADEAQPQELRLKGGPGGKNYIGPPGPGGAEKDREIVSFDGRTLTTRFVDPDANNRYGTMVYVRCAPRA